MRTPNLRRAAAATATLALALSLSACGGDDDGDDSGDDPTTSETTTSEDTDTPESDDADSPAAGGDVLSEDELRGALLTSADVPGGFTEGTPEGDDEDDDSDDPFEDTCLSDVGDFDDALGVEPTSEAETEFTLESEAGEAEVTAKASSYEPDVPLTDTFASFLESLGSCTEVNVTNDEGVTFDLQVETDDTVTLDGADAQANVTMSGTVGDASQSIPIDFRVVVAVLGNNLSNVGTSEIAGPFDLVDQTETLAQKQFANMQELVG